MRPVFIPSDSEQIFILFFIRDFGISKQNFLWKGKVSWDHCEKHGKFTYFLVCPKSPETMRKLCLSTTFKLQKIKWNYSVNLRIQSEYRKMRTRNNFVLGRFSRSVINAFFGFYHEKIDKKYFDLMLDTLNDNHKENPNSIKEFIIIKSWLLLSFLMRLSHIKECICLNNVFTK